MKNRDSIEVQFDQIQIPDFNDPLPSSYFSSLANYAKSLDKSDLRNPCIPYNGKLRFLSMQHTSQEINAIGAKILETDNAISEDLERLRFLLHDQATAMKDLEYINNHLVGVSEDQYFNTNKSLQSLSLTPSSLFGGWLYSAPLPQTLLSTLQITLQHYLPKRLTWSTSEKKSQPRYYTKGGTPTEISTPVLFLSSMILSLCSGASIVVPMIIMSVKPGETKSLITVSVAIVLFGFVLAAVLRARTADVFLATATYAAVLVVFVGVSNGNGS